MSVPLWISLRLAKLRVKRDSFEMRISWSCYWEAEGGRERCLVRVFLWLGDALDDTGQSEKEPLWGGEISIETELWKICLCRANFDMRWRTARCGQPVLLTADRRTSDGRGNSHRGARSGDYQHTLRNISEERSSHLNRGGSLKSRSVYPVVSYSRMNSFVPRNYCWERVVFDCVNFWKDCNWCQKWVCL